MRHKPSAVLSLIRLFFGLFISHLFSFVCVIATRGWQLSAVLSHLDKMKYFLCWLQSNLMGGDLCLHFLIPGEQPLAGRPKN